MKKICFAVLMLILSHSSFVTAAPVAKITIKVVDEKNRPIQGADTGGQFVQPLHFEPGVTVEKVKGVSDEDGLFSASSKSTGRVGATASKKGFYKSGESIRFKKKKNYVIFQRWMPWNPTIELVLREKRNPVKMYRYNKHKRGYIKYPKENEKVGFDLVKGDWVAPYGKGKVRDFVFVFHSVYKNNLNWEVSYNLSFSNQGDGFQEFTPDETIDSEFKWPYLAPVSGYNLKELSKYYKHYEDGDPSTEATFKNIDKEKQYIFRVRTEYDENGDIVKAMYGRVDGDFMASPPGDIRLSYYLNPFNRSLEYAGNLFEEDD